MCPIWEQNDWRKKKEKFTKKITRKFTNKSTQKIKLHRVNYNFLLIRFLFILIEFHSKSAKVFHWKKFASLVFWILLSFVTYGDAELTSLSLVSIVSMKMNKLSLEHSLLAVLCENFTFFATLKILKPWLCKEAEDFPTKEQGWNFKCRDSFS